MTEPTWLRATISCGAARQPCVPGNDIAAGPGGKARADFVPRVFQAQRSGTLAASDDYRTALIEGGKNVFIYYCSFR
jgi:hypothetical protein